MWCRLCDAIWTLRIDNLDVWPRQQWRVFYCLLRLAGLPLRCSSIPVTGALGDGGNGWMLSFPLVR